jgi:hypothetical protein
MALRCGVFFGLAIWWDHQAVTEAVPASPPVHPSRPLA